MKKILFLITVLLCTFASCHKEPDTFTLNDLYGTWQGTEIYINGLGAINIAEFPEYAFSFEFCKDNTYTSTGYFGDIAGKYEFGRDEGYDMFYLYLEDKIIMRLAYWFPESKRKEYCFKVFQPGIIYTIKMKRK